MQEATHVPVPQDTITIMQAPANVPAEQDAITAIQEPTNTPALQDAITTMQEPTITPEPVSARNVGAHWEYDSDRQSNRVDIQLLCLSLFQ